MAFLLRSNLEIMATYIRLLSIMSNISWSSHDWGANDLINTADFKRKVVKCSQSLAQSVDVDPTPMILDNPMQNCQYHLYLQNPPLSKSMLCISMAKRCNKRQKTVCSWNPSRFAAFAVSGALSLSICQSWISCCTMSSSSAEDHCHCCPLAQAPGANKTPGTKKQKGWVLPCQAIFSLEFHWQCVIAQIPEIKEPNCLKID